MTVIALVSVINHNHINGLHLFWDTLYIDIPIFCNYILINNQILRFVDFRGVAQSVISIQSATI